MLAVLRLGNTLGGNTHAWALALARGGNTQCGVSMQHGALACTARSGATKCMQAGSGFAASGTEGHGAHNVPTAASSYGRNVEAGSAVVAAKKK